MAWQVAIAAVVALTVVVVVVGTVRAVSGWLGRRMQRWLGRYFEYASIFWVTLSVMLALLVFLYFLVPLAVWVGLLLLVVSLTALLVATA